MNTTEMVNKPVFSTWAYSDHLPERRPNLVRIFEKRPELKPGQPPPE